MNQNWHRLIAAISRDDEGGVARSAELLRGPRASFCPGRDSLSLFFGR